jgi:NitT/TauT family transport system ATP-binding protein
MRQRVAIAQTMIMEPPILRMDEPFGALDPDTREDLQLFLLELWEARRMTMFFVTHDLEEALFVGTRILVLSQYYTDQQGERPGMRRGAKLVADHPLTPVANAAAVKNDPAFRDLMDTIRREGFDPTYLQHVDQFNLTHTDSFRTVVIHR